MNKKREEAQKCKHDFWKFSGYWDSFKNGKRTAGGPKLKCVDCGEELWEDWKKIERSQRHPIPKEVGACPCGGDIGEKVILKHVFKIPFLKIFGYKYVWARTDLFCKECGIQHPFPPRG